MPAIRDAIAKCEVLQRASPSSLAALTVNAGLKRLSKGEHLFWDKEQVDSLYFTAEGIFSLYKLSSSGDKKVIFVYGPGQMLNEVMLQDLPASINCEALSDALALCFPIKAFLHVMSEDFSLSKAVIDSMARKVRRLYRQLKNTTGSVRGDKRIAAKLWKLSQDYGVPHKNGIRINLDLTITYFADMLGAKRETVSRQLKQLTDAGLVLQNASGLIIPDRDKLQQYFKEP